MPYTVYLMHWYGKPRQLRCQLKEAKTIKTFLGRYKKLIMTAYSQNGKTMNTRNISRMLLWCKKKANQV